MMRQILKPAMITASAAALAVALASCGPTKTKIDPDAIAMEEKAIEARAFLKDAETRISAKSHEAAQAYWNQATNITDETNAAAASQGAEFTKLTVSLANTSKKFDVKELPADVARKMQILRSGITLPAPSRDGTAEELADITTRLDATYSTGKFLYNGREIDLLEASRIIQDSRNPAELKAMWEGWHSIAAPMAPDYARMVTIANEGARELGYPSLDQMWLSNYDMPPAEMEAEVQRLWTQVEPLYKELHCYARTRLNSYYGEAVQPATGPIRADLLGNMWAQSWSGVYDILKTDTPSPSYDVTQRLVEQGYTPLKMVQTGEAFFTSLGLQSLPETFWERSMITKPEDREVVCHASAWDLDDFEDVRIKMCTQVNSEDFYTVHHELGHNYYQLAYRFQDFLYKNGAHDGFHEAIGDFIALSITPEYLEQIGLITAEEKPGPDADTALLLRTALDKIAFLPFALSVDSWRWGVLSGDTAPEQYNQSWTDIRLKNQGIIPPGPRPADAFDPGAKYHIPGNTPYLRYFLSFIMQFQFHKAACEQAGWEGPLHRCSIYGNKEVGRRFEEMMEAGMSEPWPDTLEKFTGTREMDGSAIIEYFDPLMVYLKEQNEGQSCGW
ncbi:M2 family metallopeptidase [Hyphomonas sp. WL0036]|uniref:M2 family metallopeptidase n=1 Tax=Hyphomonas sediminis TaxID=2866160 RepID=UPI001C80CF30|nr:M2 family metallopeptidase [Hyphomonas sediminis]MBY9067768.1 M2 family metallopeptidase [Hyphomonas sediminis]